MNTSSPDVPETGRPVWTAPRLVPLTAANASDGGNLTGLTEGQVGTAKVGTVVFPVQGTNFPNGSG